MEDTDVRTSTCFESKGRRERWEFYSSIFFYFETGLNIIMKRVLVLDRTYQALNVISMKRALKKWGKSFYVTDYDVTVIATYPNTKVCIEGEDEELPAIIRFGHKQEMKPNRKIYKQFNRRNVWLRDNRCCQYCGTPITLRQMHWDHIYPKGNGGGTSWKNIVCCCKKCNDKKGDKLMQEIGMKLLNKPIAPIAEKSLNDYRIHCLRSKIKNIPVKSWIDYLRTVFDKNTIDKFTENFNERKIDQEIS